MLEVHARILQRSVFIPDEEIHCQVTFTNKTEKATRKSNLNSQENNKKVSSGEGMKSIAYASAQIACHCDINERKVSIPVHNRFNSYQQNGTTSFIPNVGGKSHCLYSTDASILFCDLKLKPGETKSFLYKEKVHWDSLPSFRGQNIKISYKILIGIGRIHKPLITLKLPFRIFDLKAVYKHIDRQPLDQKLLESLSLDIPPSSSSSSSDILHLKTNPFAQFNSANKYSNLDKAMEALTSLTIKRNLNIYNIQSPSGIVGKFGLSKHFYRLGEDILGTFDFHGASIHCFKYKVFLQMEEKIQSAYLVDNSKDNLIHHINLCRHEDCCYLATKTNFLLHIPITATPEFAHKLVSVKWRLHFEFCIEKQSDKDKEITELSTYELSNQFAKKKILTETMLWDLPLHVVAANPIQASLMMQAESVEKIVLD